MKVNVGSSKLIMPSYNGTTTPRTNLGVPLTVFDRVTYNTHIAAIYAFRAPAPPNTTISHGLAVALSEYREWAGRLTQGDDGDPTIVLNDKGVRLIEASSESPLDEVMLLKPSSALLKLHPSLHGVEELVQVQLTRFSCGSLAVGITAHHLVADGHSTSKFLVAWGRASRGLPMEPLPLHNRTIFAPRNPPRVDFEHRGVEFTSNHGSNSIIKSDLFRDEVRVLRVQFTSRFLAELKSKASSATRRPYTTFESVVAHLWRAVTKARGLTGSTKIRISVNGRWRLSPGVLSEYLGNLVLWAFPCADGEELITKPLWFAAELIHREVMKVNGAYFRSFIDFASSGAVEEEGLVPTAAMEKETLWPDLEVDSWLRFPFYDVDFGGGRPWCFMPTYFPVEGMLFLVPSFTGDGSIEAFVPLFQRHLAAFEHACYVVEWKEKTELCMGRFYLLFGISVHLIVFGFISNFSSQ